MVMCTWSFPPEIDLPHVKTQNKVEVNILIPLNEN
jgi:hypothetical protein